MAYSNEIYQEHGYDNRSAYLRGLASEYGVDEMTVFALAEMLGSSEDFDGLVSSLEDINYGGGIMGLF